METLTNWSSSNPEDLLKQVYADNYPWLENYVRQNSGNDSDAKDVFQESIAAAWMSLQQGRFKGDKAQFNAYLRQICRFKWINQIRSAARSKIIYNDALLDHEVANNGHEVLKDQLQQSGLLQECFMQLGAKCKQVLRLFYYKRESLGEIAAGMGNTEESIKTIKYRCMMQLRKLFLEQNKKHGGV
ncbi:sigma-70 family RNA polymerase sigma factor [Agriterribacter sp.]|uniref:RNA polymerase sigma factor n=1 Tax=Agriterribacter sp. TaxID=2821509 RepID=UPI002C41BB1B|nr:sigma-70 family RNA polymerase sigma factor [Agriterribacter sp.]HRO44767.1 sigma-70 family RNA polymerase sigma factor [Agriterribacter sp.]HRQ19193.1 sigma-70 family RNA polymerase sigma factor [Agriterribacter sp.]